MSEDVAGMTTRQVAYDAMLAVKEARDIDDTDYALADAIHNALVALSSPETTPAPDAGTTTDCPLEGVHEHAFRGPHRQISLDSDVTAATIEEQGLAANRIDSSAPVVRARPSGSGRCDWRA